MQEIILLVASIFSSFGSFTSALNPWHQPARVADVQEYNQDESASLQSATLQVQEEPEQFYAQSSDIQFFPFLGSADPAYPNIRSPKYSINVDTNGLNIGRSHWIDNWTNKKGKLKKAYTPKYLAGKGRSDLIVPFQTFARKTQDKPSQAGNGFMVTEIDKAYEVVRDKYLACGGGYADVARKFKPDKLNIEVMPTPYYESRVGSYVGGLTEANGRDLKITVVYAPSIITDPKKASLSYFTDWARWEIGNALSIAAEKAGVKKDKKEIGDASPCGR